MRSKINRRYIGVFIVFFCICSIGFIQVKKVKADSDFDSAINGAPQGLNLDDIFSPGTFSGNVSKVIDVNNSHVIDTDAVQINNGRNQIGSIWSTDNNYFDLNKDQTMSMWMYFGNSTSPGEGMAFVLQNDSRGLAAISTDLWTGIFGNTKKPTGGQSLGVWGVDTHSDISDTSKFATTAIQNSWALEFDTNINATDSYSGAGTAGSFDVPVANANQHIAANYPGEASSYYTQTKSFGWPITFSSYYNYLNHNGLIDNVGLTNGSWHHLTMSWVPRDSKIGTMTYTFDDVDSDGGTNDDAPSKSFEIDTSKFHSSDGKVRWGFTGSTSSRYENNLVVFESIPDLVNAGIDPSIFDLAQNKEIEDGDTVISGDIINVSYDLKYLDGRRDWKNIVANIHLPGMAPDPDAEDPSVTERSNITYTSATITYNNDASSTETISLNGMTNNQIKYVLARNLSTTDSVAKIEFTGATEVNRDTDISEETSTFNSTNYITHVETPKFNIQADKGIVIGLTTGTNQTVNVNTDVKVNGIILYAGGNTTIDNSHFTVHTVLNGKDGPSGQMSTTDDGFFGITVKAADLKPGKNTLDVYVTDEYGNKSNIIEVTITVVGYLNFDEVSNESSFRTLNNYGRPEIVKRNNDWKLSVKDERSTDSEWRVVANATELKTSSGVALQGGLIFKDNDSITSLVNNTTVIATHVKTNNNTSITDIINSWNEDDGILLRTTSTELDGIYKGTISWSLYDTI
ncbi:hypothetical protein [Companilactobacillus kedongensis]|uniref:hypothetical protein n=1 Tax=Companilactobacillus kedongensis TaxID=2486004 RepID=UPI000F79E7BB|nr:hypothetical protein [Companilactobacillus kedongensis]